MTRQQTAAFVKRAAPWAAFLVSLMGAAKWGYGVTVKIDSISSKADTIIVNQLARDFKTAVDGLTVKLDSANLRLRQIQCGPNIERGCR